jgi:hypothetical protein
MSLPPQFNERRASINAVLPEGFAPLVFTADRFGEDVWGELILGFGNALNERFPPGTPYTPEDERELMRSIIKSALPQLLEGSTPDGREYPAVVEPFVAAAYSVANRIRNAFYTIQLNDSEAVAFGALVYDLAFFVVRRDKDARPDAYGVERLT